MNRGEVWQADFEPTRGQEIRKTRPAVIISSNDAGRLNLRIVVPLTTWRAPFARALWMVRIEPTPRNGLATISAADAFQVKSISTERILTRLGVLEPDLLAEIVEAVGIVIEHP